MNMQNKVAHLAGAGPLGDGQQSEPTDLNVQPCSWRRERHRRGTAWRIRIPALFVEQRNIAESRHHAAKISASERRHYGDLTVSFHAIRPGIKKPFALDQSVCGLPSLGRVQFSVFLGPVKLR